MNRIQTLLGSTVLAGALVATPVVLGLSAAQSGAAPAKASTASKTVDDKGGNGVKGGATKHREPGDDHGRHGGGHDAGDDHGGHGTDG